MSQTEYPQNFIQEPPNDVITLPSGGLYYANKKKELKVAYLTAADENILTSPNLIQSGRVLEVLLEKKILDRDIKPGQLLSGDRNAILFFLRSTGYGSDYKVPLKDPKTNQIFDYTFNLDNIPKKEVESEPDSQGLISFMLPQTKKTVKYTYLTQDEEDAIHKADEKRRKALGKEAVSEIMTKRLSAQVREIDGVTDKGQIETFINNMPVRDAMKLRKHIEENEPGLDLEFEVEAPSGETFRTELPITPGFLWPYFGV
jgi:hypothetical protein